jgi:F0F1-type ATP synthase membrane subunit b/b'
VNPWQIEDPKVILSLFIGFALLLLLLSWVPIPHLSVPYYRGVLNERSTRIGTNKEQVDTAIAEVQQLRTDYAARLARIEEEARQRIDAAVRDSDAARAEIIAEAEQVAGAIRRRGEEEVARERTRQRILFRQQLVRTALDSAEEAIRAHSDGSVQRKLIDNFIAQAATTPAQTDAQKRGA